LVKGTQVPGLTDQYWYPYIADEQLYGVRDGFPMTDPKNMTAGDSFWPALMVQDVVLNKMSVNDALAKWQKEVEKIYGAPCSPLVADCKS
jgi:hypothetical protein